MSAPKLPRSWPPIARDVVLDAARDYYRQMSEPFPVPDVIMDSVVASAGEELDRRRDEIYEQATDRWIDRYESGEFDADMKKAIEETYGRLRRAERGLRSRAGARKKSGRQLDIEIAHAIGRKRKVR